MAGVSVQFVGLNEVLRAYDNKDCVNWAVWQGKNLNFSYPGSDAQESRAELEEWLKMLSRRSSEDQYPTQAVYTLKFYEDWKGNKITAQTAEHSAFNFRLTDPADRLPARAGSIAGVDVLVEELRTIKTDIAALKEQAKTPATVGGPEPLETWEKILDHPITMGLVGKMFGIDVPGLLAADAKLSGIPETAGMQEVIDELLKHDPDLLDHLKKLIRIAEHQPSTFRTIVGMIDKM